MADFELKFSHIFFLSSPQKPVCISQQISITVPMMWYSDLVSDVCKKILSAGDADDNSSVERLYGLRERPKSVPETRVRP